MNPGPATSRTRDQGFTIVEMLIAMTLSVILIAGVLSLVYSSKITYLENERVARNQEGGRAAFEMILRDVRSAGFPGCAQPISGLVTTHNLLANPTSLLWQLDVPVMGYEGSSGTWVPALDPVLSGAATPPSTKNDVIVVRTVRAGLPQFQTKQFTNPTDDIVVNKNAGQTVQGATFVINDCGGQTFFAAQPPTDSASATTATLKLSNTGTPANTSNDLLASFVDGAEVSPIDTVIYYVAPGTISAVASTPGNVSQPGPSLWRIIGAAAPEEVIPGVERMEIQYGVDTDGDTVVDQYMSANTVDSGSNWGNVISVRIAILVRSAEANAPDVDKKTYTLLGTSVGPFNDRYERSLFTTTVTLRNRTT
jgi:type IV pilus assembly protein PilW